MKAQPVRRLIPSASRPWRCFRYAYPLMSGLRRAIAIFGLAIAFPADAVQIYKDTNGVAYINGLTTGQFVQIAYGGVPNTIHVKPLGTCNFVKLPYKNFYPWNNVKVFLSGASSPAVAFRGSNLNAADISTKGTNLCSGTGRNISLNWSDLGSGVYGLKNGLTNGNSTAVYLVGLPSSSLYDAQDGLPALRRQKANTCGFVKMSDTARWPAAKLQTFYYYLGSNPSSSYDQASLPVQAPELCRNGILYRPS